MADKIHIEANTVMETLVMPLYGRATCSKKFPDAFPDKVAEEIIGKIDYDFSKLHYADITTLSWALRKYVFFRLARKYLKKHPNATIINLGCGADDSFPEVDNGKCRWINLDLPDIIAAREKLFTLRDREKNVAMSAFDQRWFDEVETSPEDGLFAICGGVLYYFDEKKNRELLTAMAERFPKGGICFDAVNSMGMKRSNSVVKKSGNTDSMLVFPIEDAEKELLPWSDRFESVVNHRLPEVFHKSKSISLMTKFILKMGVKMRTMQFVEISFR